MKIGLIADTHDRLPLIDRVVQELNQRKVDLALHAGDYIAPFVVSHFKPLNAKMIGVFGNNDAELNLLRKKFDEIGVQIRGRFADIKTDGLRIALLHGEEEELLNSLASSNYYDVIVHAHTHQAKVCKEGKTLLINPGEVCGYLSGCSTFAVLDGETMNVEVVSL
jgi:hypothetical protein